MTWHIKELFSQESMPSVKISFFVPFLEVKYELHEMLNFILGADEIRCFCIRGYYLVKKNNQNVIGSLGQNIKY